MIPSEVYALGASGNPIREIADYAMRRAEEVGAENVYDFSIGSPSIAPPAAVQETAQRLMKEMSPAAARLQPRSVFENDARFLNQF